MNEQLGVAVAVVGEEEEEEEVGKVGGGRKVRGRQKGKRR